MGAYCCICKKSYPLSEKIDTPNDKIEKAVSASSADLPEWTKNEFLKNKNLTKDRSNTI